MYFSNKEKYKHLFWFKVKMRFLLEDDEKYKSALSGNFRFYIWYEPDNASTCEMQEILDNNKVFIRGEDKSAIIVIVPSPLSSSIQINDTLSWGGLDRELGTLTIIEKINILEIE